MKNYFIIHGFKGSNIENWFPWFKEKVDSQDCLCIIPQFPIDDKHHIYSEWKKIIDVYNKDFNLMNENTIIIGHSTGSICALKYILENKISIKKFAKSINAKEVIIHNGGHLNEEAGYNSFPEILKEI